MTGRQLCTCRLDALSVPQPKLLLAVHAAWYYRRLAVPALCTYMLVDQQDGNIFSFVREAVKRLFDRRCLGLLVDDKKISLRVGWICNVL